MSITATTATRADERFYRRTMRQLIGALAGLAVVGGLAAGVPALASGGAAATAAVSRIAVTGIPALAAIRRFAEGLDGTQRAALRSSGVPLAALTIAQRTAVLGAVRGLLSADAWGLLERAMDADDALAAVGAGAGSGAWTVTMLEHESGAFFQFAGPAVALNAIERDGGLLVEPELVQA